MGLQESGEMYLETILILSKQSSFVRAIDVGEHMGFSKPSVSRAMGILKRTGYITVANDGKIALTDEGYEVASKIYERHSVLTDWLIHLGVPEVKAAQDACRMEHVISDETFSKIKEHLRNLK